MRVRRWKWMASLVLLGQLAVPACADTLQKGLSAWISGRHAEAVAIWRPLADQGHGNAALFLGFAYRYGIGAVQDDASAAHWYRLAAEQDVPEAQYQLGLMYELGLGVPRDQGEAAYWYGKAVGQGFCPGELSAGGDLGDG